MSERTAYDESMMFPPKRLQIQDPEIQQGMVEMVNISTKMGSLEVPWGIQGGVATVYKFRTKSGQHRALRCFNISMLQDMQFRYERIGSYFAAYIPGITARFKYHEQGILIKENRSGQRQDVIYPLIEMDWIEGAMLPTKVDELCRKREHTAIHNLVDRWTALLLTLHKNHVAHGELAGSNVMVRTDGQLILVDYDGVYIPDLTSLSSMVLGQVDYQHPQMAQRAFDENMDGFSALVIYTALLALTIQPSLWDKYTRKDQQNKLLDNNLMFVAQDFRTPDQSALIQELQTIDNARLQLAVQELKKACYLPVNQARFPFHILNPNLDIKDRRVEIFLCYARRDQEFLDNLKMHLTPLERQGLIKVWHDADISPGTDWEDEIKKHLNTADIILLLVSANFITSDYCYSKEMMQAMERHKRGEACVIPIILRSVYWQGTPFGKLQVLPQDALPVTKWQDRDDALFDVAEGIRKVVEKSVLPI
jgi:serine/threonine protein kinase